MTDDSLIDQPDLGRLIARCKAGDQDIEYDGYAILLREAANALSAERARADQADQDADAHAQDARYERQLRREAQQQIAEALVKLDEIDVYQYEVGSAYVGQVKRILSAAPTDPHGSQMREALADAQKEMVWLREQAATGVMRGKKAETALRAAPHDSGCWMASGRNGNGCTCWKSRYSA